MVAEQGVILVAGVDAEDSAQTGGRNLFQRLLAAHVDAPLGDESINEFAARLGQGGYKGLDAFLAGDRNGPDPLRIIVGTRIASVDFLTRDFRAGPLDEALGEGLTRCREAFQHLGIPAQPRLWLVGFIGPIKSSGSTLR